MSLTRSPSPGQVDAGLVTGKRRACQRCKDKKRPCSYGERNPNSCITCQARGEHCSGPVSGKSTKTLNLSPSSSRGKLAQITLSLALNHHLITECRQFTMTAQPDFATPFRRSFFGMFEILSRPLSPQDSDFDIQEIASLALIYNACQITTHSAIIGGDLAQSSPSSRCLIVTQPYTSHISFRLGNARYGAMLAIKKRLLIQLDRMSRSTKPLKAAQLAVITFALHHTEAMAPGSPEAISILKRVLDAGAINIRGGSLEKSEREETLDELRALLLLDTIARSTSGQTESHRDFLLISTKLDPLPLLPSLTPEEVSLLVATPNLPLAERVQLFRGITEQVLGARTYFVHALENQVTHLLQGSDGSDLANEACQRCWSGISHLRQRNGEDIDLILTHREYGVNVGRAPSNVVAAFLQSELSGYSLLARCHHTATQISVGLGDQSRVHIRSWLSRVSELWTLYSKMDIPNIAAVDVWLSFGTLVQLTSALFAFRGNLLQEWVQSCPEGARSIREALNRAAFSSVHAGLLAGEITATLQTNRAAERELNIARDMVSKTLDLLVRDQKDPLRSVALINKHSTYF